MTMPGGSRKPARLLPRLARLLISRNELRRTSDRVEGAAVVILLASFAAAAVATSFVGANIYRSERAAAARLRPVAAVLTQNGPTNTLAGFGQVMARWRAPDGREHSGLLTTDTVPSIWDAVAGSRVRVWVTRSGDPAIPLGQAAMILTALLVPLWGTVGAALVLILCYWLCRRALDRRRLAAWESDWALVGPRWTSRR
jgi:hypothetical protein